METLKLCWKAPEHHGVIFMLNRIKKAQQCWFGSYCPEQNKGSCKKVDATLTTPSDPHFQVIFNVTSIYLATCIKVHLH
jgi:hypothetical protein